MSETRRWDDDESGRGVAGAAHLTDAVEALLSAMRQPDWVAEDPEAHLVPHLRSHASEAVRVVGTEVAASGELVVTLEVRVEGDRPHARLRSEVFALVGEIAESSTFVEERPGPEFVVVTGMLAGQTHFASHGHTVRLVVRASDTLSPDGS